MGIKREQKGFTIIETMFFLAISGMMMIGLAVAMSNMINNQRYKDSTNRLASAVQNEYSKVRNVSNDRNDSTYLCGSSGGPREISGSAAFDSATARGTDKCFIVGRFIKFESSNREKYESYPVYAYSMSASRTPDPSTPDIGRYELALGNTELGKEDYSMAWGYDWKLKDSGESSLGILILRSPLNGVVSTYIRRLPEGRNIKTSLSETFKINSEDSVDVCVMNGNSASSSVQILAGGSSSGDVQIKGVESC